MSDQWVSFEFEVSQESLSFWEELLKGLCKGETGALFEERIEPFGKESEDALESMLDTWDEEYSKPEFNSYKRKKTTIKLDMFGGWDIPQRAEELKKVFEVCGARKVSTVHDAMEDGCEGEL